MANNLDILADDLALTYEDELDAEKEDWYQQKIDESVRLLLAKIPSVPARISSGELDIDFVKDVVLRPVMRVVRNPAGVDSITEAGVSVGLANSGARGGEIRYWANELALLIPKKPKKAPSVVRTYRMNSW